MRAKATEASGHSFGGFRLHVRARSLLHRVSRKSGTRAAGSTLQQKLLLLLKLHKQLVVAPHTVLLSVEAAGTEQIAPSRHNQVFRRRHDEWREPESCRGTGPHSTAAAQDNRNKQAGAAIDAFCALRARRAGEG